MRNTWFSCSTLRTAALIAWFDARSWPSGFSSTTRVCGPLRPAAAICSTTCVKSEGAVATYITTVSALRVLSRSASRA